MNMTREESIKKVDEIIDQMERAIVDLNRIKDGFIDSYGDDEFNEDPDPIATQEHGLIGMLGYLDNPHINRIEILYYKKYDLYIKSIRLAEYKNRKRNELAEKMLKK